MQPPTPPRHPFAEEDATALETGGVLGIGGMGEVRQVHDRRLGRDLALKTPRLSSPEAIARLVREATLTARLTHPAIVSIHSVGEDKDGRPFYTMPLLPGRSLHDAVASLGSLQERLGLVSHLLTATRAIAYAHTQGILHRDLKLSNVMIGGFGETIVADWGLACTLEEASQGGGHGGTPGYMSPEQAEGKPIDVRADIYSLGAMLSALLTGQDPPPPLPLQKYVPQAPPELLAIAARALNPHPAERYQDATALSEDLAAWFEGRRVLAYRYSFRDLLWRAFSAWKAPIVVGALGILALGIAITIGYARTIAEKDRTQVAMGLALSAGARDAAEENLQMEAEILAVNAILRQSSPDARGVLSRFGGRPHPRLLARRPAPCALSTLSPDGLQIACLDKTDVHLVDMDGQIIGSLPEHMQSLSFAGDSKTLVLVNDHNQLLSWSPGKTPVFYETPALGVTVIRPVLSPPGALIVSGGMLLYLDLASGQIRNETPCQYPAMPSKALMGASGTLYTGCSDFKVMKHPPDGDWAPLTVLSTEEGVLSAMTLRQDETLLVIGTVKGKILALNPDTGQRLLMMEAQKGAADVLNVQGNRLAGSFSDGTVQVWDLSSHQRISHLSSPRAALSWMEGGDRLRISSKDIEDWSLPFNVSPHLYQLPEGISAVAVSPSGEELGATTGIGQTFILKVEDGRQIQMLQWSKTVVKDLAWSADGSKLAIAITGTAEQRIYDTRNWTVIAGLMGSLRRVAWMDGQLVGGSYLRGLHLYQAPWTDPPTLLEDKEQFWDLEANAAGTQAAVLDDHGGVWRLTMGDTQQLLHITRSLTANAVALLKDWILAAEDSDIVLFDKDGRVHDRWHLGSDIIDIAVSGDERWVAVGHRDGNVSLLHAADGSLAANLLGHSARVASLSFSQDSDWLFTGGWDGAVRSWWLPVVDAPVDPLKEQIEGAWGRGMEAILEGP